MLATMIDAARNREKQRCHDNSDCDLLTRMNRIADYGLVFFLVFEEISIVSTLVYVNTSMAKGFTLVHICDS